MAEIRSGNWSHRDPGGDIPAGSTIYGGNFSQLVPDTVILSGVPLTIHGGNWVNVHQDINWTVDGGNWAQVSRCAHLHPEWPLDAEPENCSHVIATDEIVVDSGVVATIYTYQDKAV